MSNNITLSIKLIRKECKDCILVNTCENKYIDGDMGLADAGVNMRGLSNTVDLANPIIANPIASKKVNHDKMDIQIDIKTDNSQKKHINIVEERFNKMMAKLSKTISKNISR